MNRKWLDKRLKLKTGHQSALEELESEVGWFCADLWDNPTEGRLLILCGENGTGKTHCAKAVRRWIADTGYSKRFLKGKNSWALLECIYWSWPKLLDALKDGQWDLVDDMFEIPVLIIDELGGEHDPSRVGIDKLCQVLSRRERKWTLITTNILPNAWELKFDRRIASRFYRNSTIVDLSGVPDFSKVGNGVNDVSR